VSTSNRLAAEFAVCRDAARGKFGFGQLDGFLQSTPSDARMCSATAAPSPHQSVPVRTTGESVVDRFCEQTPAFPSRSHSGRQWLVPGARIAADDIDLSALKLYPTRLELFVARPQDDFLYLELHWLKSQFKNGGDFVRRKAGAPDP
jgi:hypothetical protein